MKENLRPRSMMYPSPAVVAGAYDEDGNPSCCTLAFATMCSHKPPALMIAINTTLKRKTLADILKTRQFTVAFPSVSHVAEVDYMGIDSSYDVDKIEKVGFTTKRAEIVNAPIINEFKLSVECNVMDINPVGSHTQITGEIVNVQADEDILEDGKISFSKLDPLAYDDVRHDYYRMGDKIADAFKVGLKFRD